MSTAGGRLKREDFRRTKHDSAFSDWKILVGPTDWDDHAKGKEGAERYRTQNLPNWTPCPGVYELGIGVPRLQSGRVSRKFDSSSVVPVYLGQADNLRNRLQQYGRDGAHLENGSSNEKFSDTQCVYPHRGPALFSRTFSRGFPVLYRYACMRSKKEAEMTEKDLLDKFDYAWNKGGNGVRRDDDAHKKLRYLSKASQFYRLARKLLDFNRKPVGIKIRACKPGSLKSGSNTSDNADNNTTFSRIFGIKRVQAEQVQNGSVDHATDICGVVIGHGFVCTTPPVKGRKRCAAHKGMRVNGYISQVNTLALVRSFTSMTHVDSGIVVWDKNCGDEVLSRGRADEFGPICGFILDNGCPCEEKPFQRNKRCLEHKGRRIRKI